MKPNDDRFRFHADTVGHDVIEHADKLELTVTGWGSCIEVQYTLSGSLCVDSDDYEQAAMDKARRLLGDVLRGFERRKRDSA